MPTYNGLTADSVLRCNSRQPPPPAPRMCAKTVRLWGRKKIHKNYNFSGGGDLDRRRNCRIYNLAGPSKELRIKNAESIHLA
jgi:hypothetical protein